MAVDVWQALRGGGRLALDLLEYSVLSIRPEMLFGHLAEEYRNHPTAARALALFDVFCAAGAPARIEAGASLPPRNLRLLQDIRRIREDVERTGRHNEEHPDDPRRAEIPARHIFDPLRAALAPAVHDGIRQISADYDPTRSPVENLPGGRLTAGQRQFIEQVWRPRLRPHLVHAGFRRISTVGG